MKALVVGHAEPAAALTSALSERGVEAELHAAARPTQEGAVAALAGSLVELENRLLEGRPAIAVAVGAGDAPLALALSAAKLGVPLAAWATDAEHDADALESAERRILGLLADFDAGVAGDGAAAFDAAERIVAWADLDLDA